jgi:uncharacterized LabA/DUF88 family protein
VCGFIDGFNLYHAIDECRNGPDKFKYQKYKWLCLSSLLKRFIQPETEELVGVEYFTTYPTWDESKRLRHLTYVRAQEQMGVRVHLGEFKVKDIKCYATCKQMFQIHVEKETDINIATHMIEYASMYDKLILVTADSDQVPAIHLLKKMHPQKQVAVLFPIDRGSKELVKACGGLRFTMTEQHLMDCQLDNPVEIPKAGKPSLWLAKPKLWP